MGFYDSLTGKIVNLKIKKANIYACGPTVYDFIHIGNARPLLLTDLLLRYFSLCNIEYDYLLNLTDIDDKIIAKAKLENKSEKDISEFYITEFNKDFNDLNLIKPTKIMKVTDNIDNIVNFTNSLIEKKFAYISESNVFFDISQVNHKYGNLSNQDLKMLVSGDKNDEKDIKKSELDFSVWKNTNTGIVFKNPFGKDGRPGWHTECAYFNYDYFKNQTIDFHIGGIDLKFPHHENERIMFYAISGKELSNVWMHNGHINVNSQKMSKSLNNTISVREFNKDYSQNTLRYIFYTTNYKKPININDKLIETSLKWNNKNINFIKLCNWQSKLNLISFYDKEVNDDYKNNIIKYLEDDLNSSMVISQLDSMYKELSLQLKDKKVNKILFELYLYMLNILGFSYIIKELDDNSVNELKKWNQAVINKDFDLADKIRSKLIEDGVF